MIRRHYLGSKDYLKFMIFEHDRVLQNFVDRAYNCMISSGNERFRKLRITLHPPAYWCIRFYNPPLKLLEPRVVYDLHFHSTKEHSLILYLLSNTMV